MIGFAQICSPDSWHDAQAGGRASDEAVFGDRVAAARRELIRRVSSEPGAGPVAIAGALPGMSSHEYPWIQVEGVPPAPGSPAPAHNYNDHEPPHFHAVYQDQEILIEIQSGIVAGRMSKRALRLVLEWAEHHQNALLENWQRARARQQLRQIPPLE